MLFVSRLGTSIFLIGGVIAVALAAGLSLFFGSTPIPPDQVLGALFSPDMANQEHVAILELRGPRTVGCILVGAAFAVAGAIMQGVTRNPLADSGSSASTPEPPSRWRCAWRFCRA